MSTARQQRLELEKYRSWPRFIVAWISRAFLRTVLRTTCSWKAPIRPSPGYTIVIGVPFLLWDLVEIPLRSIARADRSRCDEVILSVDATEVEMQQSHGVDLNAGIAARFPGLVIRVLYYTSWQRFVTRIIGWNWVDCWLTWATGIRESRSRWVLLHDFDAIIADPAFAESQLQLALDRKVAFVGIMPELAPVTGGVRTLLMTIELLMDAEHVRRRFVPVDLFNRVRLSGGLRIECDILRDVQLREDPQRCLLHPVDEEQVIHPSQLVTQWRQLRNSTVPFRPSGYTPLLAIPYFRYLGGASEPFRALIDALARGTDPLEFEGGRLSMTGLDAAGRDWIAKQVDRMNDYFQFGDQGLVRTYTNAIREFRPNNS